MSLRNHEFDILMITGISILKALEVSDGYSPVKIIIPICGHCFRR